MSVFQLLVMFSANCLRQGCQIGTKSSQNRTISGPLVLCKSEINQDLYDLQFWYDFRHLQSGILSGG